MKRKIFYIIIGLVATLQSFSQTDTEFWFAAPAITPGHENKPIVLRMTSYDKPAVITIAQPANASFTPIVINLNSNSTTTKDLTTFCGGHPQLHTKPNNSVKLEITQKDSK